ncbi:FemAB family PEP-CTERM system-associated protein [Marinobacter nanhaiticus D15-8W]|uniref:FemAB family PEP-CTERM system-associated protein n=1 Tax=Marinobacter nanhaiticus D15-8W TaxID=626887 RepID=N6VVU8_9GAMM|nr:FemAB family XrtA/PEP-CTERM system-associated protein [Marinobacter nanhaiticus]ENO14310.1 FemAB family PEP-CTERM system-associated protein [Marinobacter nanhaiticus D15-8W]BES71697.1 FemAB family PEP-CTERM system-associated protein [Marinobacter nanhaiticus D15-8W]
MAENSATSAASDNFPPPSKEQLDALKARKGQLSRQVGEAKKNGLSADDLIEQLKQVSDELKALQKAQKQTLNRQQDDAQKTQEAPAAPPFVGAKIESIVHQMLVDPRSTDRCAAWDRYVDEHPAGTAYHRMGVRRFIENTYGHQTRYLCALGENGEIVGVLPLVQLRSRLFGNFVVSVPYFNYGGVLADNRSVADRLIEAASGWSDSIGASHVEFRHMDQSPLDLPARKDKITFWLNLPKTSDDLWNQFKPKLRAQIRRAEREEPEWYIGGLELLNDFYDVFAANMRDLGTPVYGKRFFRNLIEESGLTTRLVVVKVAGKPCGCAFLLGYRKRMEIPWASTLREFNSSSINMYMYWRVLEFAIEQGYRMFDFGRCTEDAGTYRFKRQWGAEPLPMRWDYKMAPGVSMPGLNPDNPKFRLLIAIWQRMPVWLTRILGPGVVKSLP